MKWGKVEHRTGRRGTMVFSIRIAHLSKEHGAWLVEIGTRRHLWIVVRNAPALVGDR